MGSAKYFIMKLLNVNRCFRKGHFSNFVIYKKDGAGGLVKVPYKFNDPVQRTKKGEKYITLLEDGASAIANANASSSSTPATGPELLREIANRASTASADAAAANASGFARANASATTIISEASSTSTSAAAMVPGV